MLCPSGRALAVGGLLLGAALAFSGCSGGGDSDFGLKASIIDVDTTTFASMNVVKIDYRVTGPRGTVFDILAKYRLLPNGELVFATPAPVALGVPPSTPLTGNVIGATDGPVVIPGSFEGTFYWWAGPDLGFLPAQVQFQIRPFNNDDPENPNGSPGTSGAFTYTGGNAPRASIPSGGVGQSGAGSGPGNPGGTGRAGHTAEAIRGTPAPSSPAVKNILIAGGYNDAPPANAFDSADRFLMNQSAFSHTRAFSGLMNPGAPTPRALHASSFFLDPSSGIVRVLAAGGVNTIDPTATTLAGRVAGATEWNTGSVYTFTPIEQVVGVANNMLQPRYGHTATWIPSNQVVIIGGATGIALPMAVAEIEHFDPSQSPPNGLFVNPLAPGLAPVLAFPRVEHTATLLADGTILVCGGYSPSSPTAAIPCEIYDPRSGTSSIVLGSDLERFGHTATRLTNGWVLIVGGRSLTTGTLLNDARIYRPENSVFDPAPVLMDRALALHAATLLGNRQVLISGGLASAPSGGPEDFTSATAIFRPEEGFTPVIPVSFSSVTPMLEARAEHTATATDCGTIFVIGGRNSVGSSLGLNFLNTIEFFPFSNAVPVVTSPMTATSFQGGSTLAVNFTVDDANDDGGYVVIRFRTTPGSGNWRHATIVAQSPSTALNNFPNHEVHPGEYTFIWSFGVDGVASNSTVEIQIIPFGAAIGSPVQFIAQTP